MLKWKSHSAVFVFTYKKPKKKKMEELWQVEKMAILLYYFLSLYPLKYNFASPSIKI